MWTSAAPTSRSHLEASSVMYPALPITTKRLSFEVARL
jgi:hypothetical protein